MTPRQGDSAAIAILNQVWDHSQKAAGHSWLKLNHAMADTLSIAIKSGMRFGIDDFEIIAKRFRSGYWIGADPEWIYKTAVLYRNASAYHAWEARCGRKPFIWSGASISAHTGDGPCGQGLARLIVGAEFKWSGEKVRVSSFNDKNASFSACSYQWIEGAPCSRCEHCWACGKRGESKLLHRYTITHADLKAAKSKKATL